MSRPVHRRRREYEYAAWQDAFIVPLLKERIERAVRQYAMPQAEGALALDVGCGEQPFRRLLEDVGYTYVGLDASQNSQGSVDIVAPIDAPLPREVLDGRQFNFILCTEVLEHVSDWRTTFDNFALCLRVGGLLVITCPHFYPLHEEPHDFWRPTLYALEHFGTAAGLRIVSRDAAGDAWDVLGTLLGSVSIGPVRQGILARLTARAAMLARELLLWLLRSNIPRRHVGLSSLVYLSNVVVFAAPEQA